MLQAVLLGGKGKSQKMEFHRLAYLYELMKVFVFVHQVKDEDEASEDEGVLAPIVAAVSASVAAAVSPTEPKPSQIVEKKEEKAAEADQKVFILRVNDN